MDVLDLALNPRKANRRFSPFVNSMPEGLERRLRYAFGDRATADVNETALYSRDVAAVPAALDLALKRKAWAVVRPATAGALLEVLRFSKENGVPVVPRGAGTTGTGGATPTEGGVVVDLRSLDRVLAVDKAARTVTVEAGIRFWDLETALRAEGLALRQYPTSARGATVGGWMAAGGGGVGSHRYGPFAHDVVEARVLLPDGVEKRVKGGELDLFNDAHGVTGFITEVTLRVREATADTPVLVTFPEDAGDKVQAAIEAVQQSKLAWSVHWYPPAFASLFDEAAGARVLPMGKHSLLVVLEGDAHKARLQELLKGAGGDAAKDADAEKAWDARFDHLNFKRFGPTVLVAESVVDAGKVAKAVDAAMTVGQAIRQCVWVIGISPTEYDVVYYALDDERRAEYPPALGNSLAVMHAIRKLGGRPYGTGVLLAAEAKKALGAERLKRIRTFKKEHDKADLFNPGPLLGARMRGAPVRMFSAMMRMNEPALRMVRGSAMFNPADDPSFQAKMVALGRARAGDLAEVDFAAATCIPCGFCDSVAPERRNVHWQSEMPRGRVQLATLHLRGKAVPTREGQRKVLRNPLSHATEAICPVKIPINRVTDLIAGTFGDALGPLPEHEVLAANVAAQGNFQGKPRDQRAKWAAFPVTADSRTLFVADDVASYDAPDVAEAAAAALANGHVQLAYLGAKEPSVGTVLVETGNRAAARATAATLIAEVEKRKVHTVVTPDANTWRVLRLDYPLFAREADKPWTPEVKHTSEVLADLLKTQVLALDQAYAKKAVLHVPEALEGKARDAVLDVAKAVPGLQLLDWAGDCCGHGRALHLTDPDMQTAVAEDLLKAAVAAGAEVVLTANPGCAALLKTAAKKAKAGVEIVDLHEVVVKTMKLAEGGAPVAAVVEEKPKARVEPEIPADHYRVEFVKEDVVLAVHKNASILAAGEEAGLELPSSCKAGSCDTCSAKYEGTPPDQSAGSALSPEQQKTYVLTCIARPKGPVKIWSDERPK